jgi:hypothetical protein
VAREPPTARSSLSWVEAGLDLKQIRVVVWLS